MKYERFKNNRFCKTFILLIVFVVSFSVLGFAGRFPQVSADTQFYEDLSTYVVNDWENYASDSKNGMSLTNNGDGTITLNGTTSVITEFVLPITAPNQTGTGVVYLALLYNNTMAGVSVDNTRLYLAYNNGANITSIYKKNGISGGASSYNFTYNNYCLVLRIPADITYINDVFTPFCMFIPGSLTSSSEYALSISLINQLLGPAGVPADLTKVNYIGSAEQTSLVISTQTNKTFGNELQNLIQYSFEAGDTITVDNAGETALYIDLLTMTAGNDSYIMRFNNDAQSNDYLSVYLYKNNDYVYFYNDNTGEITAGNITAFRTWGVDAINNGATITSGSQFNNNIINKIFVYSTGTNYETGYTNGYRDGYDAGEAEGFEEGTENGYFLGYGEGYDQGAIDGLDTSWLVNLFQAVNTFFDITILPGIKIGTVFAIPFVLSIAWVIIRILRGGGYGD